MGLQIEDGMGGGHSARVDSKNRLRTYSVIEKEITHASEGEGGAYSWTSASADIDAGDTALYLVNNSTSSLLMIESIYVWANTATAFKIHCPAYATPAGGTLVTGVNLNRSSGNLANAIARTDETANTFAETNVIKTVRNTYYSRGNGDDLADIAAAGPGITIDFYGALILGYHNSVAIDIIAETTAFQCTIVGYYHT